MDLSVVFKACLYIPVKLYEFRAITWSLSGVAIFGLMLRRFGLVSFLPRSFLLVVWWSLLAIEVIVLAMLVFALFFMARDGASYIYWYAKAISSLPILACGAFAPLCRPQLLPDVRSCTE